MKTYVTKPDEVQRKWFLVDATDKVLGRLAAEVACLLRGKKKPIFQPNIDTGDYVIIINAEKVKLTGFKEEMKSYWVASKYPGHSRKISYKKMKENHPERVIEKAVKGMLPHNILGRKIYRKLHVYAGSKHKHYAQKPEMYEL